MRILEPFPAPPDDVAYLLTLLDMLHSGDKDAIAEADAAAEDLYQCAAIDLPRPWDPTAAPPALRAQLWEWFTATATWFNRTYARLSTTLIPGCWPQHPDIVSELATLTCSRWWAFRRPHPLAAEEWHQHSMPRFTDRLTTRMGTAPATQCVAGHHVPWPAAADFQRHESAFTTDPFETDLTTRM